MSRRLQSFVLALLISAGGCSTGAPQQTRDDAVLSGEETAKAAAEAARKAEKDDNTGVLIESSEPAEPEPDEQPAEPARSVLRIELRAGTATMSGEPIPEGSLGDVVRDAVRANPDVLVVFERDSTTGPEATERYMQQARDAGAKQVEERPALP